VMKLQTNIHAEGDIRIRNSNVHLRGHGIAQSV
jgi:hypothetical protein